ncbi:MAG: DUF1801 domain-containing protein [Bifidobacteriaceae bacterium]|jgi:uncharacterized protein YdhG (YjbR/CyaY superfamily)|nr:DUF1801 domain-containing protein [Bifidobacteriaceae bacterium]
MTATITFADYLESLPNPQHRQQLGELLSAIQSQFPQLEQRVAWNQPMFTDHGTFIIGFSAAKAHFSVAIEDAPLELFSDRIAEVGLTRTSKLFRIPWGVTTSDGPILDLLLGMVRHNIDDKKNVTTFWRK